MTFFAGILTTILLAQAVETSEPATQPTTQPTLEQLRSQQKADMEKETAEMPKRGKIRISKLLSFDLVNGDIVIKPLIGPTEAMIVYEPIDWPGWFEITVGTTESSLVSFNHVSVISEEGTDARTFVSTAIDNVQIGRDSESDSVTTNISLIQNQWHVEDVNETISFRVNKTSNSDGVLPFNLALTASSFEELRRRHPKEVRQYLGPILKDLHAESLIQNNDLVLAWQVLSPYIEPQGKINAKIGEIIKKLSADDFVDRAKAEDELATLGPAGAAALSHWDLNTLPPDPKASVENFVRSHQKASKEIVKELQNDPDFLLDMLAIDDPAITSAAQNRLGEITGKNFKLPEKLTQEEKLSKIEEMRKSLAPTTQP